MVQYRLAPGFEDNLQIFPETVAQLIERDAERQSLPLHEAMPDAKLEPASAQTIECGIVLGNPKRVVVREQDHCSSDPNSRGPLRNGSSDDRGGRKKSSEGMKMVFRQPDRIEAELFGVSRLLHDGAQPLAAFCASGGKRGRRIKKTPVQGRGDRPPCKRCEILLPIFFFSELASAQKKTNT